MFEGLNSEMFGPSGAWMFDRLNSVREGLGKGGLTVIIASATEKGGSAKTTFSLHLAWRQAKRGKVLLVDCDAQASATRVLLRGKLPTGAHIGHVLLRHVPAKEAIVSGAGEVDILPSASGLAGAIQILGGELGPERRLASVLAPLIETYDHIILDCAPGRSLLFIGALLAASKVIAPTVPDIFGVDGLKGLLELVGAVRQDLGGTCDFAGAVVSRSTRTKLSNEVVGKLRADLGPLFLGAVPDSVKMLEALAASVPVWEHAPDAPVALAMEAVCDAVLNSIKGVSRAA